MKLHIATISIILILGAFSITQGYGTSSNNGINWMKYCNMAPDFLVSEPCDELVDSNNELTSKGERVLLCLGGGTLAVITGNFELLGLRSAVGCSGSSSDSGSSGSSSSGGIVDSILSKLLN